MRERKEKKKREIVRDNEIMDRYLFRRAPPLPLPRPGSWRGGVGQVVVVRWKRTGRVRVERWSERGWKRWRTLEGRLGGARGVQDRLD